MMKMEHKTVTPAYAAKLLEKNTNNRNIRELRVKQLTEAILRGEWEDTPYPVTINTDNVLEDGQHRLLAVIRANKSVKMVIATGVSPDIGEVIDTGAARKLSDTLKKKGEERSVGLAAVLRQVYLYRHDPDHNVGRATGGGVPPTNRQLLGLLKDEPAIRESVLIGERMGKLKVKNGGIGLWGALHYLFSRVSQDDADAFFGRISSGSNIQEGEATYALRRTLMDPDRNNNARSGRLLAALTIKAFNAWRKGENVTRVLWRAGGYKPEPFPLIADIDD